MFSLKQAHDNFSLQSLGCGLIAELGVFFRKMASMAEDKRAVSCPCQWPMPNAWGKMQKTNCLSLDISLHFQQAAEINVSSQFSATYSESQSQCSCCFHLYYDVISKKPFKTFGFVISSWDAYGC